jgi:hypothetical protein
LLSAKQFLFNELKAPFQEWKGAFIIMIINILRSHCRRPEQINNPPFNGLISLNNTKGSILPIRLEILFLQRLSRRL